MERLAIGVLTFLVVTAAQRPRAPVQGTAPLTSEELLESPLGSFSSAPSSVRMGFQNLLLVSGFPGGVAAPGNCDDKQERTVRLKGKTLHEALETLVHADDRYRWRVDGGVVNLLPVNTLPALLGTRVSSYDSRDAADIATAGAYLMGLPEVRQAAARLGLAKNGSGTGLYAIPRGAPPPRRSLGVRLQEATVLEILNAIVRKNGHGVWFYTETGCGDLRVFEMGFAQ